MLTATHPEWDGSFGNGYDIALLRLTSSSKQRTVPLSSVTEGQRVATLGWGRLSEFGVFPTTLQEITDMEVTVEDCMRVYSVRRRPYVGDVVLPRDD